MKYQAVLIKIILPILSIVFCNTESFAQEIIKSPKPVYETKIKHLAPTKAIDTDALVQWVLRVSYNESVNDLKQQATELKKLNDIKKQIRKQLKNAKQTVSPQIAIQDYKLELELFRTEIILASANQFNRKYKGKQKTSRTILNTTVAKLIENKAYAYSGLPINGSTTIPNRIPRKHVKSLESLDKEIAFWDKNLNTLGEDGQLFNINLQGSLQQMQQYIQMMSNISKMQHDTNMAIIRKLK